MKTYQRTLNFHQSSRGTYNITTNINEVVKQSGIQTGLCQAFILHTSASLTLNENADPDVRHDLDAFLRDRIPGDLPYFRHTMEGPDDMPAHIAASLLGTQLTLAVRHGRMALGTWQGIWLGEHRDQGGARRLIATLNGE